MLERSRKVEEGARKVKEGGVAEHSKHQSAIHQAPPRILSPRQAYKWQQTGAEIPGSAHAVSCKAGDSPLLLQPSLTTSSSAPRAPSPGTEYKTGRRHCR